MLTPDQQKKVDFIKSRFPEIDNKNPLFDTALVDKIKKAMLDAGFYKKNTDMLTTSTLHLILKAKGVFENYKPSKKRKPRL